MILKCSKKEEIEKDIMDLNLLKIQLLVDSCMIEREFLLKLGKGKEIII